MGLMNFIRANLPESWEKAATELKMKTELITRLHANVPRIYNIINCIINNLTKTIIKLCEGRLFAFFCLFDQFENLLLF